jgi:hypothetical protein
MTKRRPASAEPAAIGYPCHFCGFRFDMELLGRYGCPNCEGAGLADEESEEEEENDGNWREISTTRRPAPGSED